MAGISVPEWALSGSHRLSDNQILTGSLATSAARPRLAATWAADLPRRASAVPRCSFFRRPMRVAAKASNETASTGMSSVCHGSQAASTVEIIRLAVINAPVRAAAGVAARNLQVTRPRSALNPSVQITTEAETVAQPKHASSTSVAAKGNTASNTSFDCQARLSWATPHPNCLSQPIAEQ